MVKSLIMIYHNFKENSEFNPLNPGDNQLINGFYPSTNMMDAGKFKYLVFCVYSGGVSNAFDIQVYQDTEKAVSGNIKAVEGTLVNVTVPDADTIAIIEVETDKLDYNYVTLQVSNVVGVNNAAVWFIGHAARQCPVSQPDSVLGDLWLVDANGDFIVDSVGDDLSG